MVRLLDDLYPDSMHMRDAGLREAGDAEIWRYAADNDFTIVSKDSDIYTVSIMYGPQPKVVWLRMGNGPTEAPEELLQEHRATVERFHADPKAAFLALG